MPVISDNGALYWVDPVTDTSNPNTQDSNTSNTVVDPPSNPVTSGGQPEPVTNPSLSLPNPLAPITERLTYIIDLFTLNFKRGIVHLGAFFLAVLLIGLGVAGLVASSSTVREMASNGIKTVVATGV